MKTQRSLPPTKKKKKDNILSKSRKTQRWRVKQIYNELKIVLTTTDFPCGLAVKNLPANEGDMHSIPGLGRFPGERNGYPLQYSCLENPMDRGALWASVHGIARVRHDLVTKQLDHYTKKRLAESWGILMAAQATYWDCLPPKVPSLLFLPWSIIFKANFFLSHRLTLGSQFWQPVLKFPCFQSILHTTGLLKTHPTASLLRLDLWVVPTTLSHCPSHCITSGFWKTPSSPLASVSPLLSLPVHSASFSSDSTPSDPITLGDAGRGGGVLLSCHHHRSCLPRVYHKWSLCTASNSWVCVPSM